MAQIGDERGQATVLFALAAVALLSMASLSLDAGRAYIESHALKTAADAAALAGGQDLPQDPVSAATAATQAAQANGVAAGDLQVSFSQSNTEITVTTQGSVRYFFAPLFGVPGSTLHATSAVEVGPMGQVQGAVPLGVQQQPFTYGQTYTLKAGAGNGVCGDYGALDLTQSGSDDNGASNYEANLQDGFPGVLHAGDTVPTKPGNMKTPTDRGLSQRMQDDPSGTWETALPTEPRVLYLPVISQPNCGRSEVTIVGFAAFYLQSVQNGDVTGVFLHMSADGQFSSGAGDFGLEGERLIQ